MTCCRACAMGSTARRMPRSRYSLRGLAQLGQLDASGNFDVSAEMAQGKAAVSTAQNVTSSIQQFGDAPTEQQQQQTWGAVVAGANQIVPGSGSVLDTLYTMMPHAGAGPGNCVTNPPHGPLDTSNPFYASYTAAHGSYAAPAPGSFEAYAYPLLARNAELVDNCYPNLAIPWGQLLAGIVWGWNATHAGPVRTITRTGLNAWGAQDPLAYALSQALTGNTSAPGFNATPPPPSASIQINGGAWHRKVAVLHLPRPAAPVRAAAPAASSGSALGAIAGGAALAAGVWTVLRLATHKPILPSRLRRLVR
jgi:hypothetical protein